MGKSGKMGSIKGHKGRGEWGGRDGGVTILGLTPGSLPTCLLPPPGEPTSPSLDTILLQVYFSDCFYFLTALTKSLIWFPLKFLWIQAEQSNYWKVLVGALSIIAMHWGTPLMELLSKYSRLTWDSIISPCYIVPQHLKLEPPDLKCQTLHSYAFINLNQGHSWFDEATLSTTAW